MVYYVIKLVLSAGIGIIVVVSEVAKVSAGIGALIDVRVCSLAFPRLA